MSTDYDIACADCRCRMGIMDANHAEESVRLAIERRATFEMIGEYHRNCLWPTPEIDVRLSTGYGFDCDFMLRHKGHALEVVDEYDKREWQPDPTRLTFEKLAEVAR